MADEKISGEICESVVLAMALDRRSDGQNGCAEHGDGAAESARRAANRNIAMQSISEIQIYLWCWQNG